jgi:tetratricopeptide (TPR) repeat protein
MKIRNLIIFIFFLSACSSSEVDVLRIKELIDNGEITRAEQQINEAFEQDSSNVEVNLLYADLLLKKGEYKAAYYFLNRARAFDSTHVEVNLKLSEFHLYLGQFEKAIASANDVLRKERNNAKAYFLKGISYKEYGDTAKAYSNFQTVIEQDANFYDAYIQLGILASAKHDSTAVHYFDNALSLKPMSPEALFNKARFYQMHGALNKAFNIYITIPQGNNFYGSAVYNSANILYEQGRFPQAKHLFDIASQYNNPKAFYMKGLIHEREGHIDSAKLNYEQSLNADRGFVLAEERLSKLSQKK